MKKADDSGGTWYVYMVRCADGTLYTGITTDVDRRLAEHNGHARLGARYTRSRRPVRLWHVEPAEGRAEAARREAVIKKMTRAQKERLAAPRLRGAPDRPLHGWKRAGAGTTMGMPFPVDISEDVTLPDDQRRTFRALAAEITGIDTAVYQACGKDPLEPIIGLGDPDCRVGFFGRDPGRDEVEHGLPFIGAGGQKVRRVLYSHLYGREMPDFEASVSVGEHFFWINTVPYKPVDNRAWAMKVKKLFQPLMADLLVKSWHGTEVITLGREAFLWFAINQPKEVRRQLERFWARGDRFTASTQVALSACDGTRRTLRLHPLPHPSPLNAVWYRHFPELLSKRLQQLDLRLDNLRVVL